MRSTLGAVLAGGTSRRMGRDKALATVAGKPLAERAIQTLEEVFDEVVLVSPVRQRYDRLGVEVVPDLAADRGPLGGLQAALRKGSGKSVFLLACDLPFVSAPLVRHICTAEGPLDFPIDGPDAAEARIAEIDGRLQPLCGLYSSRSLRQVDARLDRGELSMVDLVAALHAQTVPITPDLDFWREELAMNVNHPWDLTKVRAAMKGRVEEP